MATPQSSSGITTRFKRNWDKHSGWLIKILAFVAFIIMALGDLRGFLLSGALASSTLAFICYRLSVRHQMMGNYKTLIAVWWIAGVVSIGATLLLLGHNGLWSWLHWLHWPVLLVMFLILVVATPFGLMFKFLSRKNANFILLGEVYLLAAMLSFTVITMLAAWYGRIQSIMLLQEESITAVAIAVCFLAHGATHKSRHPAAQAASQPPAHGSTPSGPPNPTTVLHPATRPTP